MSESIAAEVEAWLDRHWDSENRRQLGTDTFDEQSWLEKVVDAGYAVPTWSRAWFGLELNQKQAEVLIPVLEKHLGVPKDRMFVSFRNVEREDMAWNGSLFSIIMKK